MKQKKLRPGKFPIKASSYLCFTCMLNFDDLQYLFKTTNMNFDIIVISETRVPVDTLKNSKTFLYLKIKEC